LNATTTRSNFLISGSTCTFLKLARPRTGKNGMRMRVDKSRHDHTATRIDHFAFSAN